MPRGQLRIYLGAAPGAGKTYAMLDEGIRRSERGADVVVGAITTHRRSQVERQVAQLEDGHTRAGAPAAGTRFDVDALLRRRPDVVLVDDLAHREPEGAEAGAARWEGVEQLIDAGVHVVGTLDISEIESMAEVVSAITDRNPPSRVPDRFVRSADQIHFVDQTPEALRSRLAHGNIFPADDVDAEIANSFRPDVLSAVRIVAFEWMLDWLTGRATATDGAGSSGQRAVVVALTGATSGPHVIASAGRLAHQQHRRLVGVHVRSLEQSMPAEFASRLEQQRRVLHELGGDYVEVTSGDVAGALIDVCASERASQLVLGASRRSRWATLTRGSLINDVLSRSPVDVHVVTAPDDSTPTDETIRTSRAPLFAPRRLALAWITAILAPTLLAAVLGEGHPSVGLPARLLLMVLAVTLAAVLGGAAPALVSAVLAFLLANWFFIPPLNDLSINNTEDAVSLVVFLVVAVAVGVYVSTSARRSLEALTIQSEASTLAAIAGTIATKADPVPDALERVRLMFGAEGASLFDTVDGQRRLVASAGADAPADEGAAVRRFGVGGHGELLLSGASELIADRTSTSTLLDQLAVALEQRRLRSSERRTIEVDTTNQLQAALLAAVSHDLRTPLASVKTAISGLRQPGVSWSDDVRGEMLETIESGVDRLGALIDNLLDLTRIEAGAVELRLEPVLLDEVVHRAALRVTREASFDIRVSDDLPAVRADPVLLEHVVMNLVDNAAKWSPPGGTVRMDAAVVGGSLHLRVIDHGRGIAAADRAEMLLPFRRGAAGRSDEGSGLGLAVADGFARLMGIQLVIDDTPGGGTTVTLVFPSEPGHRV